MWLQLFYNLIIHETILTSTLVYFHRLFTISGLYLLVVIFAVGIKMSEKPNPKTAKVEDENKPLSRKRNLSSTSDHDVQTGPAGHSLLDSLKLGGKGDRMPVELIDNDNSTNKIEKEKDLAESNPDAPKSEER